MIETTDGIAALTMSDTSVSKMALSETDADTGWLDAATIGVLLEAVDL